MAVGRKPKAVEGDPILEEAYDAVLAIRPTKTMRERRAALKRAVAAVVAVSGLPPSECAEAVEDYR